MKWFDIPPVWLVFALVVTYWLDQAHFFGLSLNNAVTQFSALILIWAGLTLILLAIAEMRLKKTTIMPHLEADQLVQSGIFKFTRNPIYLGDVLILTGFIFRWDTPLALPMIPALLWILKKRFITPEENSLRCKFKQDFKSYIKNTRRWV